MHVMVVYGTRPEAIKMAPVIDELRRRTDRFSVTVCATAQHRELMDQVHRVLDLRPDMDLDLMRPGQTLNGLAARSLQAMQEVLGSSQAPDWVLVQGDTSTAMAVALAAFHLQIPVGHVEAGLRTGDLQQPFPEEANRCIIDLLADALFAPTRRAGQGLLDEGVDPSRIHLTGNTGIDTLLRVAEQTGGDDGAQSNGNEVLITMHRRESFGAAMRGVLQAFGELAGRFPDHRWIFPVHHNPNVREPAREILSGIDNLQLCSPLHYVALVRCLQRVRLVLTDSGGIQEEAPTFGTPVLVLRDTTERPEGVQAGVARLVGTDRERIVSETSRLLSDEHAYRRMVGSINPYGDGRAAEQIVKVLSGG